MIHRLSTIGKDVDMFWWVCTCRDYGPVEDSHLAAIEGYELHLDVRDALSLPPNTYPTPAQRRDWFSNNHETSRPATQETP